MSAVLNSSEVDVSERAGLCSFFISCNPRTEGSPWSKCAGLGWRRTSPIAPKDLFLELPIRKNVLNNGRYVAMEAAVMAMPTSTLDQMTRSTVAKRKSDEVDIWWIALTRIKVAT